MTRLPDIDFVKTDLTTPPCPHFDDCGSCQLQHVTEEKYRNWKESKLRDLLIANGLAPKEWLPPVFVEQGTRRRVTFAVKNDEGHISLGFNKYRSHDLVYINTCLLLTPRLEALIDKLPEALNGLVPKNAALDIMIQETDDGLLDCVITGLAETGTKQTTNLARLAESCDLTRISFKKDAFAPPQTQIHLAPLTKTSGALSVVVPAGAFLQPSAEGESALVTAVMDALKTQKIGKKDKVADLFSGCGTFAGHIMERYAVHAVEGDYYMAGALREAAKGHSRFSAEQRDLFKEPVSTRELRDYKALVFDPPRAGAKEQARKLAKSVVPLVIGVSCNPETFSRDAKTLIDGGYVFKSAQMIDQFTWSTHSEVVGIFEKI